MALHFVQGVCTCLCTCLCVCMCLCVYVHACVCVLVCGMLCRCSVTARLFCLFVVQYVREEDLDTIRMTRPEMRRLRKYYKRENPHGAFSKLRKVDDCGCFLCTSWCCSCRFLWCLARRLLAEHADTTCVHHHHGCHLSPHWLCLDQCLGVWYCRCSNSAHVL